MEPVPLSRGAFSSSLNAGDERIFTPIDYHGLQPLSPSRIPIRRFFGVQQPTFRNNIPTLANCASFLPPTNPSPSSHALHSTAIKPHNDVAPNSAIKKMRLHIRKLEGDIKQLGSNYREILAHKDSVISTQEQKLQSQAAEMEELKVQLAELSTKLEGLEKEEKSIELRIIRLSRENALLEYQIHQYQREIERLEEEKKTLLEKVHEFLWAHHHHHHHHHHGKRSSSVEYSDEEQQMRIHSFRPFDSADSDSKEPSTTIAVNRSSVDTIGEENNSEDQNSNYPHTGTTTTTSSSDDLPSPSHAASSSSSIASPNPSTCQLPVLISINSDLTCKLREAHMELGEVRAELRLLKECAASERFCGHGHEHEQAGEDAQEEVEEGGPGNAGYAVEVSWSQYDGNGGDDNDDDDDDDDDDVNGESWSEVVENGEWEEEGHDDGEGEDRPETNAISKSDSEAHEITMDHGWSNAEMKEESSASNFSPEPKESNEHQLPAPAPSSTNDTNDRHAAVAAECERLSELLGKCGITVNDNKHVIDANFNNADDEVDENDGGGAGKDCDDQECLSELIPEFPRGCKHQIYIRWGDYSGESESEKRNGCDGCEKEFIVL